MIVPSMETLTQRPGPLVHLMQALNVAEVSNRGLLPLKLAWQLLIRELVYYSLRDLVLNFV